MKRVYVMEFEQPFINYYATVVEELKNNLLKVVKDDTEEEVIISKNQVIDLL